RPSLHLTFDEPELKPNGSLDKTFDGDGAVGIDSGGDEQGTGVAVQPDGKIVVTGWTSVNDDAVLYRLNRDGSMDSTFNRDGAMGLDNGGGVEIGHAVVLQSNGQIVVAGHTSNGDEAALWRVNPNGSPDNSFDGDGMRLVNARGLGSALALALRRDGKLVIAGFQDTGDDAMVAGLVGDPQ